MAMRQELPIKLCGLMISWLTTKGALLWRKSLPQSNPFLLGTSLLWRKPLSPSDAFLGRVVPSGDQKNHTKIIQNGNLTNKNIQNDQALLANKSEFAPTQLKINNK